MDYDEHVAAATREIGALQVALRAGPLDAPVPSCPDWTVSDLAVHVGSFMGFWTHVICEATGAEKTPFPDAPDAADDPDALCDWFEELAAHLVGKLETTASDTEVWTWVSDNHTQTFIGRRCAHELAVHRYDAQLARNTASPIEAALAADAIEEIFHMMANRPRPEAAATGGETIHLHGTDDATDDEGTGVRHDEWLITLAPEGIEVTREHAKGDLAIRAAVSDLALLLYRRPTLGPTQRFGDDAVLDAWYRTFRFG